ncbi:MAG: hypothetical protein P4L84_27980 [Isosphaeraceae bacterium]|nr:hypothetical protein [Isosphaeraceae bacterium]
MTDEEKLIEKLRRIEALYARPGTEGERAAAASARERIQARLRELEQTDAPVEYSFTVPDSWSHRLLVALLRRYGVKPYRYRRQRHTTIMARVSPQFVEETLWPEYQQLNDTLHAHLDEVTTRLITEALQVDTSDAEERDR